MKVLLIDPPELFLRGDGTTRQVQPLGLACGQIRHPETIAGLQWLDNGELVRAPPLPRLNRSSPSSF